MTRGQLKNASLGPGAALLLTFLFVQQRPVDPGEHNRFTRELQLTKQLDAEINRDVLYYRYELLGSYDSVVRQINEARKVDVQLRSIPRFIRGRRREQIGRLLKAQSDLLAEKVRLVEAFKSDNAILKNSIRYFPALVSEVSGAAVRDRDPRLQADLAPLLRDILLFDITPHSGLIGALNEEMEILSGDADARPGLSASIAGVRAHAGAVVRVKPQVERIAEQLTSLSTARSVDAISVAYLAEYDEKLKIDGYYRAVLYLCSVILLGYGANRTMQVVRSRAALELTVRQVSAAHERYELAVRGANDGLWDWDLLTGKIYFSPRWKGMLGFGPEELADDPASWFGRIHSDDRDRVQRELDDHVANRSPVFESEHRVLHSDGICRWMLCRGTAVRAADGQARRMAGSQTDITGNKSSDPLTGLANRLLFTERLSQIMREAHRGHPADYAVLFLDVDRFKVVNDSLGHVAGDSLLRQIAQRLKGCVRSTDVVAGSPTVARLGGDEFGVLLEKGMDADIARAVAERVVAAFARPFPIEGRELVATFSVGVAVGNAGYLKPEDILRDADIAMYEAKVSGKARAEMFDPSMLVRARDRMEMEGQMRAGIENGEFSVFYQSKVDLDTEEIIGFEALVRWNHPTRGRILPGDFIPLAEETGLIVPLGYWVLRTACLQLNEWQRGIGGARLTVSVNISSRQFTEPDLVERVAVILNESGITPASLDLELTETAVMRNPDGASRTLRQLKAIGIGLNMDDFGTGHSSLSYLQRFPFDTIKIDRSFVGDLGSRAESRNLIKTIVDMAESFKMKVVAEGVETDVQSSALRALGCHQGQGYLFSKPVNALSAGALIAENQRIESEIADEAACLV
jgi:diguanylate cyclase (GGDEF)-like protein/PAS domain S-box-containing protein